MISEQTFTNISTQLDIEPAIIKTVAEVESHGNGFLPNGKCKILFEPHIFWQQLIKRDINPLKLQKGNEDILYKHYGERPYGFISAQWPRLERARLINVDAANSSASWGKFQVMGFNWQACGFNSLDNFITAMQVDENQHLQAFAAFVTSKGLISMLKNKEWAEFALNYNGAKYKENNYDTKLSAAYLRFSSKV